MLKTKNSRRKILPVDAPYYDLTMIALPPGQYKQMSSSSKPNEQIKKVNISFTKKTK